jgi:hypothetical protein
MAARAHGRDNTPRISPTDISPPASSVGLQRVRPRGLSFGADCRIALQGWLNF